MLVSHAWLKEFVDFDLTPKEVDSILTMLGIEVEHIYDYKEKFNNYVVGFVAERNPHPNADKLSLCKVDCGEPELVQVVCGAPNVAQGQKIAFAKLGAYVHSAGFAIEKRKIRGEVSQGMICSQKELELGEDGSGIWVLPEEAPTGMSLAEYLNIADTVYEISVTPNRADALSHLGIAREISAYLQKQLKMPLISLKENTININSIAKVSIECPELCPRYMARVVLNAEIKESPDWLKNKLTLVGLRPINNVVDATNFVLMNLGHPLHAFDFDKVAGKSVIVKTSQAGEKYTTLDSKERELPEGSIMICDEEKYIGVAGVMGGENSEITNSTKNIIIESAYFNPSAIRRTSKKLALQSDASYRFERGADINVVPIALDLCAQLIAELSGGEIAEGAIDCYPNKRENAKIELRFERTRNIIGAEISNDDICALLERLNCKVIARDSEKATFDCPTYRVDINEEIDLVEEVVRMYNYDNLEPNFYTSFNLDQKKPSLELQMPSMRKELKSALRGLGFNEILTQNMLDPTSAALFTDNPVKIANPLGEEMSIMRPAILPSILKTIERNIRFGNKNLNFFEIGKTFEKATDGIFLKEFNENERLAIALCGSDVQNSWAQKEREYDFYDIKGIVASVLNKVKIKDWAFSLNDLENVGLSANSLKITVGADTIGYLGEIAPAILKKFEIESAIYYAEIDLTKLYRLEIAKTKYKPAPAFPASKRDLAFLADKSVHAESFFALIKANGGEFLKNIELFDVYEGKNLEPGKRSLAFALSFFAEDRTLTQEEVEKAVNKVIEQASKELNAKLRDF